MNRSEIISYLLGWSMLISGTVVLVITIYKGKGFDDTGRGYYELLASSICVGLLGIAFIIQDQEWFRWSILIIGPISIIALFFLMLASRAR